MAIASRSRRAAPSDGKPPKANLPWAMMFVDYGLSITDMPDTPPPSPSDGYGAVLQWVTGTAWEMDEHVDLAIDIWRRKVDPQNYRSKAAAKAASPAPAPGKADANSPAQPAAPIPRLRRLGGRKPSASPAPAPGPKP